MLPIEKGVESMAGKKWNSDEDDIIRNNHEQLTASEISSLLPGRTKRAVDNRRKTLGLKTPPATIGALQSQRWVADLEARLGTPMNEWLKRRYIEEQASYREITAEIGINTRSLMKLMRLCDIEPISSAEALARSRARDPNFLDKFIKEGGTYGAACARAQTRQRNWWTFCTPGELAFLDALRSAGLDPIPQLAITSYNVDFAFPGCKLAVECDPRWHMTKSRLERDRKRDAKLTAMGWTVLRLDTRASMEYKVRKVSDALSALASTQPR